MLGTAIVTPFNENGINYEEYAKLIEFQIKENVDSIIVCGTTGEASTMSSDEKRKIIKYTVEKVNKRVPVIAGTGGNNTKESVELSKYAKEVGTDGLLIVTPYYNKTTQKGLIAHFTQIANNVNLPIILYNVPSRTGLNITPDTCYELSKIENIVAMKEASGDISQVAKIAKLCGDNLQIYSGNDDQIIPLLSLGGIGVISVLSNIAPKYTHDMVYKFLEGNTTEAMKMQLNAIHLIDSLFCEVNPIPVKMALNLMGYNFGDPRLPLITLSENNKEKLKKEMEDFYLI